MRSLTVWAMLAVALAACGRATEPVDQEGSYPHVEAGDTVRLRFGETAILGSDGPRIVFRAVVGDSRCPINAVCVWAGDAHILLDGIDAGAVQRIDLHTTLEPKTALFAGYRLELLEVAPAPVEPRTAGPEDYSVRLAISRG